MTTNEKKIIYEGTVVESFPNGMFGIRLNNGNRILGYISGKIRQTFLKILVGDRVQVEVSRYDLTKGRIVSRLPITEINEINESNNYHNNKKNPNDSHSNDFLNLNECRCPFLHYLRRYQNECRCPFLHYLRKNIRYQNECRCPFLHCFRNIMKFKGSNGCFPFPSGFPSFSWVRKNLSHLFGTPSINGDLPQSWSWFSKRDPNWFIKKYSSNSLNSNSNGSIYKDPNDSHSNDFLNLNECRCPFLHYLRRYQNECRCPFLHFLRNYLRKKGLGDF